MIKFYSHIFKLTLICFLLSPLSSYAQEKDSLSEKNENFFISEFICYNFEMQSGGINLQYINNKNFFMGGINLEAFKPYKSLPIFSFLNNAEATDNLIEYFISYGRIITTPSHLVRFKFAAGPSLYYYQETVDYKYHSGSFISDGHYSQVYEDYTSIGLHLYSAVDFPLLRWLGLAVVLSGNINSRKSFINLGVELNFGKLRN